jgi:CMP-N,N'-diacetyllegionaminic acid synthase
MSAEAILCTICARGGSKGVKSKNCRSLNGKPLLAYSIEQALAAGLFEHIVVSTDSDEISKIAVDFGAEVFFRRPPELATDIAPKIPVIRHALQESEAHYQRQFKVLVDLDATSPLRSVADIRDAYQQFRKKDYDNLITAMPARRSPYFNLVELTPEGRVVLSKKLPQAIVRRQDAPPCFDMNASIYIWKRDVLLMQESLFLEKTGLFVMPEERSIDIDTEFDFKFVAFLMSQKRGEVHE